jgi:hypothetical protein
VEQQLIELYLLVRDFHDKQPGLNYQRLNIFKPRCTDEELLTMYLFGWSRFISGVCYPLESLFSWLIQRTELQNASRLRSTKVLFVHSNGELAVARLLLTFYS